MGTPPGFAARVVVIAPGAERAYDESEWRDALVLVERGALDVEPAAGGRRRFRRGALLCLAGLPLRALGNRGHEPVVLLVVRRAHERTPG